MGEVVATDEFRDGYRGIEDGDARAVARGVDRLGMLGVALPFPFSSALAGSAIRFASCAFRAAAARCASSISSIPGATPCCYLAATRRVTIAFTSA